jgi:hypothetical protein
VRSKGPLIDRFYTCDEHQVTKVTNSTFASQRMLLWAKVSPSTVWMGRGLNGRTDCGPKVMSLTSAAR